MPDSRLGARFPGYDVLSKRQGLSWNDKTREVMARRLRIGSQPKFFTEDEFLTVIAAADRIVPQPATRSRDPGRRPRRSSNCTSRSLTVTD